MNLKEELGQYRHQFEKELFSILDYWDRYGVEKNGDGFYGAVDLKNNPIPNINKSCVLNSRILWTFSAAAKMYPGRNYEKIVDKAYKVVTQNFSDNENGGFYMELSPSNKIANNTKHSYVQAFVLYSLCKHYEYAPHEENMQYIKEVFFKLDEKMKDPRNLGYFEAFTNDWKLIKENRMADNNEPKTMNTHLHLLEAYTALYKIWKGDLIKQRLTELLDIFIHKIIRESGHLGVFFTDEFEETSESKAICSFGHDVEASWLLWEAAETLGNHHTMERIKPLVLKMADAVLRTGVDKDGGLFYESTGHGSYVLTDKHWWPQAENLVGYFNAFQLNNDKRFWETVKLSWNFIDQHVIDHEGGEWFTKVSRSGKPFLIEQEDNPSPYYRNDCKIDPWKCPYHNGRAMMELIQRIDK